MTSPLGPRFASASVPFAAVAPLVIKMTHLPNLPPMRVGRCRRPAVNLPLPIGRTDK
jgi:hypothetical protein